MYFDDFQQYKVLPLYLIPFFYNILIKPNYKGHSKQLSGTLLTNYQKM